MGSLETQQPQGTCLVCDRDGNIVSVAQNDLGLASAVVGRSLLGLLYRDSLNKGMAFVAALQEHGTAYDWELVVSTPSGLLPVHFCGGPIEQGWLVAIAPSSAASRIALQGLMQINNEQANRLRTALKEVAVTRANPADSVELYEDLTRLNNELAGLQRELAKKNVTLAKLNQQKNDFLGMAAHDLRNPLGVIQTYSQFLIDEAAQKLSPEQREFLDIIRSTSGFVLGLVEDLLDVATIESGHLAMHTQETALVDLVQKSVTLNRALSAPKDIAIALDIEPALEHDDVRLDIDTAKIEQVLNNLLTNAVKYSARQTEIRVSVQAGAGEIVVSVHDQGQGIAPQEMDNLFKMFSTTSTRTTAGESSTGLGLAIARRVVEGHKGRIWATSELGVGSTFGFALPWDGQPQDAPHTPAEAQPQQPAPPEAMRVLVADDSRMQQRVAEIILGKLGHTVSCVSDGQAALDALAAGTFDVVLLDLHMPGLDGFEVAQRIRTMALDPLPRIIALTGSVDEQTQRTCRKHGILGPIPKPLCADAFSRAALAPSTHH